MLSHVKEVFKRPLSLSLELSASRTVLSFLVVIFESLLEPKMKKEDKMAEGKFTES